LGLFSRLDGFPNERSHSAGGRSRTYRDIHQPGISPPDGSGPNQLNGCQQSPEGYPPTRGPVNQFLGVLVANLAPTNSTSDGSYNPEVINFEIRGWPVAVVDYQRNWVASFQSTFFPGVLGTDGYTDNFATEVITYLELSAGTHLFGISVGADRTDFSDDDGYVVFAGTNCRDFFAPKVAEYVRVAAPFYNDQHTENQWTVTAPVDGIYPFRLVYWQTALGGSLHWYTIDESTAERILVNDPNDPRAIKAYRDFSLPAANAPYISEVSPMPGTSGNSPAAAIEIVLVDGLTTIEAQSIKMYLNQNAVTPQLLEKSGRQTNLKYYPNASRTNPANVIQLVLTDSANASYTNTWEFLIKASDGAATQVTGQWDFNFGDLRATVGQPLEYFDPDGSGFTRLTTQFGPTTEFGIPDIDSKPTQVMQVPGDYDTRLGYVMHHGIAPNGGGIRVNQYTLIMDLLVDTNGVGAVSLIHIRDTNNLSDGDLFWQDNNFGQGNYGYVGTGQFTLGEWHRICAAYDEAGDPPMVTKFVDGIKQDDWTANQGVDHPRCALLPTAILFADGDQDERRVIWVSSIQIRSGKLSDAEMKALGGPSMEKIPLVIPNFPPTTPPKILFLATQGLLHLSWTEEARGFTLETTTDVRQPTWIPIEGVTNNSASVPTTANSQFFRLKF
jgi:hypothetical protein